MPIVSSKGIAPYTGSFTEKELKHLLRRTNFGASRAMIASYAGQTLTQVTSSILTSSAFPSSLPLNFYQSIKPDPDVALGQTWITAPFNADLNGFRVRSFKTWLIMNYMKDTTITEKMTLFLHSFIPITHDVNDPRYLYFNYKMLRDNCLGNFKTIIKNTLKDPGMLQFLNGNRNQKNAPDENLARELQELFTIGKGFTPIYSEDDIKAAAKVLTGYEIDFPTATYKFTPARHDTNNKTFSSYYNNTVITGKSGAAGETELDDLVNMIFAKDDVALHFVRKLYGFFVYYDIDATVEANVIVPLANMFRTGNYEILPVVQALFRSEHFFDTETFGSMIKSPIDFNLSLFKEFEIPMPDATDVFVQYEVYQEPLTYCTLLSQEPYDPPNVSGWAAYYQLPLMHETWISTDSIAYRYKLAVYSMLFDDKKNKIGYTKRGFQIQNDLIKFTKTFPNPADPNKLIEDVCNYLHTIPPNAKTISEGKYNMFNKTNLLDSTWTNAWNDHIANPNDLTKKTTVYIYLFLMYKYIVELAEFQLI